MSVEFKKSPWKNKKLVATFYNKENVKTKSIHFGDSRYSDFTTTGDLDQRKRYLLRSRNPTLWKSPYNASSLARYILWGPSRSKKENMELFSKRFKLKLKK